MRLCYIDVKASLEGDTQVLGRLEVPNGGNSRDRSLLTGQRPAVTRGITPLPSAVPRQAP